LNKLKESDLMAKVKAGNYHALHYMDFTGEGWIGVDCPPLENLTGIAAKSLPAYSLVSAPDFFPACDQRELTGGPGSPGVPPALRDQIWNIPPDTLCDVRLPANLQLLGAPFSQDEQTITALVPMAGPVPPGSPLVTQDARRHSHLPDDAA